MKCLECDRCGMIHGVSSGFKIRDMDRIEVPRWNVDDRRLPRTLDALDLCPSCAGLFREKIVAFCQNR
jgi:hypothetical protein